RQDGTGAADGRRGQSEGRAAALSKRNEGGVRRQDVVELDAGRGDGAVVRKVDRVRNIAARADRVRAARLGNHQVRQGNRGCRRGAVVGGIRVGEGARRGDCVRQGCGVRRGGVDFEDEGEGL